MNKQILSNTQSYKIQRINIIITIGVLCLLKGVSVNAYPGELPAMKTIMGKEIPLETDLSVYAGKRVDELDWNIAGNINGTSPNILSELEWENLKIDQLTLQGNIVLPNILAIKGSASYGWIKAGDNQDSDYFGDNRTLEFSRSNNAADDGDVMDASLAIGYPFRYRTEESIGTVTLLGGYSYHEQNLRMTEGNQTIPALGPFPGLDSTYDAEWDGPWVGVGLRFKAREIRELAHKIETFVTYEYHWYDYYAVADWNLRSDFMHPKSYDHTADGSGWKLEAGFYYWYRNNIAFNFKYDYSQFSTDSGVDTIFFSDGTTGQTKLNEVNWRSYSWSVGILVSY